MKKVITFFCLLTLITGCDDGDIIFTEFNFDDVTLEFCEGPDENENDENEEFVFFRINDTDESIALNFSSDFAILTRRSEDDVNGSEEGTYDIELSGNDAVIYRRFDSQITSDYYCNSIPPSTPLIQEELISNSGNVRIRTTGDFDDNDGISAEIEDPEGFDAIDRADMLDTDGDGIPNIYDSDDDGDNVLTVSEGVIFNDDGTIDESLSADTDGDGILNYLDPDDDGDGVLTINEDADGDLDPANDNSDPNNPSLDNYLNDQIFTENIIEEFREHIVAFTNIQVAIDINNLVFFNEDGSEETRIESNLSFGTYTGADNVNISMFPVFN